MTCRICNVALFVLAQGANKCQCVTFEQNLIFLQIKLNVSGGEICCVNIKQFWFEHYPPERKIFIVVLLTFFTRKKVRSGAQ